MVGPSARGSENGTPTSMKSAPAPATTRRASSDDAGVGKPAVRYAISAARRELPPAPPPPSLPPAPFPNTRQRAAMGCSDKVVGDVDAVLEWVGDLHDRPREMTLCVALGEVRQEARVLNAAVRRGDDADHGAMHVRDVRVGAVDQGDLVGVEDDARPDGIDPDQVDERLDDDLIVAAARVLPHFLEHLVRLDRHRLIDAPAGGSVEPIGDGDDLRVNGELAAAQ